MVFGDILALLGLLISALVFLWMARLARMRHLTIAGYLLGNRSATRREFGPSMVAASTSLATVVLFFLGTAQFYGLALLFCGVSYLAGQAIFIRLLGRANIKTSDLTTNADFWRQFAGARFSAFAIGLLTVTAFLIILFIELYIGSVIIQYYFKDMTVWTRGIAFVGLGAIVIAYVRLGGMRIVFKTDGWQLRLMIASMIALLIFALTVPVRETNDDLAMPNIFTINATLGEVLIFWSWIALINFTLPFTQLSSWQRIAATSSVSEAWSGLLRTVPAFLTVWLIPVFAFVFLATKGYQINDLSSLLDAMREGPITVEGLLYPILFVGFASALFSTADSAMIALQLAAADKSLSGEYFYRTSEQSLRRRLLLVMVAMIVLLAVVFALAEAKLGAWFIPLVFAIFGQLTILAPQLIYALVSRLRGVAYVQFSRTGDWLNVLALLAAWMIMIVATILKATNVLPAAGTQEVATFVAVAVSSLGILAGHTTRERGSYGRSHA